MRCWSCLSPLAELSPGSAPAFCPECGARQAADFGLELDLSTIPHLTQGHRCELRLRGPGRLWLRSSAWSGLKEGPTADFVPAQPGLHRVEALVEKDGGVYVLEEELSLMIAAPGQVNVAHIEIGRVGIVDNLRVGAQGELVAGGQWKRLPLRRLPADEAGAWKLAGHRLKTARGEYRLQRALASGDFADLYLAQGPQGDLVIKLSRDPQDNDLLIDEARYLGLLHEGDAPQRRHIPALLDQFQADGRVGLALERCEDGVDLYAVKERYPQGIAPEHLIWIFRRCLSVLGHAHHKGLLHGNIEPAHVLLRPRDHMVWLVDWTCALAVNEPKGFKVANPPWSPPELAARLPPIPSSDLYSLGKVMIWLLGGDPATHVLPPSIDERLGRFLLFFVRESARQRAQDAWEMYSKLDLLRKELYGPHRFIEFSL